MLQKNWKNSTKKSGKCWFYKSFDDSLWREAGTDRKLSRVSPRIVCCIVLSALAVSGIVENPDHGKPPMQAKLTVIFNIVVPNKFSMYRLVCVSKPYPTIMYPKTPQWDTDHSNIPCHAVFRRGCVARESNVTPQYIGRHPVTGEYITGCQLKCMILFLV